MKRAIVILAVLAAAWRSTRAGETDTFSLHLDGVEISDVLHLLARQHGLNIVATQEVRGPITVHLTDVTAQEALDAVLRSNGFDYRRQGRILQVFRPEADSPESSPPAAAPDSPPTPEIRVIPLVHGDAAEMLATLKELIPEESGATFETDERRNAILVKALPEEVEGVASILHDLDQPVPQIRIEVLILETLLNDSEHIGVDWFARFSASGARRPITFPFDNGVTGGSLFPKNQTQGEQLTFSTSTGTTSGSTLASFPDGSAFPFTQVDDFIFGYLDATQLRASLELIQRDSDTKLVARPEVTTINNREALISIGNTVPIPIFATNEERAVTTISGYEDRHIGTVLRVKPRVAGDGLVTMRVQPEVSEILEFRGEGVFQIPVESTRSADTRVTLADGKTLVIAGLVRERNVTRESKFPLLGDIPLLGYLFSYRAKDIEKSELTIFITPHIMAPETLAQAGSGKVRVEGKWLAPDQIETLAELRRLLGSDDPEGRMEGIRRVGRVRDEAIISLLDPTRRRREAFLHDADPRVRSLAARTLARQEPDVFLEAALEAAARKNPGARAALVDAALAVAAPHIRLAAAEAAAAIDRAGTVRQLAAAVAPDRPEATERACIALWALGQPLDQGTLEGLARAKDGGTGDPYALRSARRTLALLEPRAVEPTSLGTLLARRRSEGGALKIEGSDFEKKRIRESLDILAESAPSFHHLVRSFVREIRVGPGPSGAAGVEGDGEGILRISRRDLESWPTFSLAHQIVRFADAAMLASLQRPLSLETREALAYRTQFWAVATMFGLDEAPRDAYRGFLDRVLADGRARSAPSVSRSPGGTGTSPLHPLPPPRSEGDRP